MKKFLLFTLLASLASAQVNVQKTSGTNVISNGNIVVGNNTSITATGNGTIAATSIPSLSINTTAPLTGGGALTGPLTLAMPAASGTTNGYLTSVDWATFNGKQPTGNYITSLTGDVTASGPGAATATVTKINGVALSGLATGLLKNTNGTGVPSIAIAGTDYVTPAALNGYFSDPSTNVGFNPSNWRSDLSLGTAALTDVASAPQYLRTNWAGWGDSMMRDLTLTADAPLQLGNSYVFYNYGVGGETSTQVRARMVASTSTQEWFALMWEGRNNYTSPAVVQADLAAQVAFLGHTNYLIIGITNGEFPDEYIGTPDYNTLVGLNSDLAATYGVRFINILPILIAANNGSPGDLEDVAHGIVPRSLRYDALHLNYAGGTVVLNTIKSQASSVFPVLDSAVPSVAGAVAMFANPPPVSVLQFTDTGYVKSDATVKKFAPVLSLTDTQNKDTWDPAGETIAGINFSTTDATGAGAGIIGAIRMRNYLGTSAPFGFLGFYNAGVNRNPTVPAMGINYQGFVGIGTEDPTQTLDVRGNAYVRDGVTSNAVTAYLTNNLVLGTAFGGTATMIYGANGGVKFEPKGSGTVYVETNTGGTNSLMFEVRDTATTALKTGYKYMAASNSNTASRNWSTNINSSAYGDFEWWQSNSATTEPLAGTKRMGLSATGLSVVGTMSSSGDISTSVAGKTVLVKSGSNALAGTVTLTAGAGTISSTAIDANTVIVLTLKTVGGTILGQPYVDTITPATGCTLAGGGASNTSTYNWVALKVN